MWSAIIVDDKPLDISSFVYFSVYLYTLPLQMISHTIVLPPSIWHETLPRTFLVSLDFTFLAIIFNIQMPSFLRHNKYIRFYVRHIPKQ